MVQIRRASNEPIAIIGSACRFPGSLDNPSKLWEFLCEPKDLLSKVPTGRFNADAFFHPDGTHHGTGNVTESYFLQEDPRLFDAGFFNIKPVEAHSVDPQHRILLEVVYESLEAAGQSMESLAKSQTGVYVGVMCDDFMEHVRRDIDTMPMYMATGTARSLISNRISYFFDWHGPSMTIDTACSSSLVAVHQAVQLLRSGDSDLAVAAGSNIILGPELYIAESKLKMLSPTGRSRMWDANADGYARGEGVACVILKRLSDAIRDGDHIESVIRESGINSDGRTKGLTMPNELAQADLITSTYRKAGLDPTKEQERCQFFEAHGTGTEAGDCREAEGISRAFFGFSSNQEGPLTQTQASSLYVGSIKTTIGHTEGTAGLAGLLKASLAVQHSTIPPNMLFDRLSPAVAPFYNGLEIVTKAKPWPQVNHVRRASVNSFGFGGTNAHIILENHDPAVEMAKDPITDTGKQPATFTPFVFSAASETALHQMLQAYAMHLTERPELSPPDLSHTLLTRRSALGVRVAFPASPSPQHLASSITDHLELVRVRQKDGGAPGISIGARPLTARPRILGVFTGQGAQWAGMGQRLIQESTFVRDRIQALENALSGLPVAEQPSWSLTHELLADTQSSRLDEALIAQPLCTAIQIVLVDLLCAAGVEFAAVVGHSSGEIAAAYAAHMISAEEAIKIAYYRGWCLQRYVSTEGRMMAVGTSLENASELCALDEFDGRLCVAACNSPSSVTLSGDSDAIEEAKAVLEDEKKFARVLKVDKAYHSHHMTGCSIPYQQALHRCGIEPRSPLNNCAWYSSVHSGTTMGIASQLQSLKGEYWKDNMLRPVRFAQAIETAVKMSQDAPFNMAIEVGAHPALKGPATETLAALYEGSLLSPPLYTGTLQRGTEDIGAFSATLGSVWSRFATPIVDFIKYEALATGQPASQRRFIRGLPTYKWDHDRVFWHESRTSRATRNRKEAFNALLGKKIPDGVGDEMRWRNIIRPSELRWISGHQLQGQMVYPAAAYLSTAVESCAFLAEGGVINTINIQNFELGRALAFDGNNEQTGVETVFVLRNIAKRGPHQITADFAFHAAIGVEVDLLSRLATGNLLVTLQTSDVGEPAGTPHHSVPQRPSEPSDTAEVPEDDFYSALRELGYEYYDDFRGLSCLKRKINYGSAYVRVPAPESAADAVFLHPALLDAALQASFLAYCHPGDKSLDQLHLPTGLENLSINASLCRQDLVQGVQLPLESFLTTNPLTTNVIGGDIDVYGRDGKTPLIQLQGLQVTPLVERTSDADRTLFMEHIWGVSMPDGALIANSRATPADYELATNLERLSLYYMKKLVHNVPPSQRRGLKWHHEAMFNWFEHVLRQTAEGRQRYASKDWLGDTQDQISDMVDKYPASIDIKIVCTVGENLEAVVREQTQIQEHMFRDNLLNRYYVEALGLCEYTGFLSRAVAQIVHRYPHMDILEIGAGTGGATKAIMAEIGRAFSSYTFTDISAAFMEKAQDLFPQVSNKMVFKTLDIEKDVADQGYQEHSYDLVIGSLVLHATKNLDKTLQETRRLLKPGGYLLLLELISNDVVRTGFTMSGLSGWWLGQDDGRQYSPCVTSAKWHQLLLGAGFSGIDTITPEVDILPRPASVIVSQAVDKRVRVIRQPLMHAHESNAVSADNGNLVIIGGQSLATVLLIDTIIDLTRQFEFQITRFLTLEELTDPSISATALILNLTELDQPVFSDLTDKAMRAIQNMVDYQRTILWVTQGSRADEPHMNMSLGLGRSIAMEVPGIRIQFLDLDFSRKPDARLVAETLLRLRFTREEASVRGMLYTAEQEMFEEEGCIKIPRLQPLQPANNRYNASKRSIVQAKSSSECPLILAQPSQTSGYAFYEAPPELCLNIGAGYVRIDVTASTLLPVIEDMYGVVGLDPQADAWVLGFSRTNGSHLAVQKEHLVRWGNAQHGMSSDVQGRLLALLTVEARCSQIALATMSMAGSLVVNEPPTDLALRLLDYAAERNTNVVFTFPSTTDLPDLPDESVVALSLTTSRRAIRAYLPPDVALFLDCSSNSGSPGISSLVASCMPTTCWRITLAMLGPPLAAPSAPSPVLAEILQKVISRHGHHQKHPRFHSLSPATLVNVPSTDIPDLSTPAVLNWKSEDEIPVKLQSVDSMVHLDESKSYVLFGLTGDLGRSVVDWMGSHGARNVVLTSRHPNIDAKWLDECQMKGMRVEVFANDITDQTAVEALVGEIRRSFPPIAGIMHGAMVLEDGPFSEMSLEAMTKVLRPKVLGTIHLDHLFRDNTLDFFVFFSSLASSVGNRGQSNYSAANMYMTAKTFERRRSGLAASVLHLGAVMGVGYVSREWSRNMSRETVFSIVHRAGFDQMDERAFHQCVAEAILASHPDSGRNPEIVTCVRVVNIDEEASVPWADNPRFSHFITRGSTNTETKKTLGGPMAAVKPRLLDATSSEEIIAIITDAVVQKLQVMLQIRLQNDDDRSNFLAANSEETGIDSLVAVEIRSWFQKEMEVDVPVLMILGGATVEELIGFAAEKLPIALTPNLGQGPSNVRKHMHDIGSKSPIASSLTRGSDISTTSSPSHSDDVDGRTSVSRKSTPPPDQEPKPEPTTNDSGKPGSNMDVGLSRPVLPSLITRPRRAQGLELEMTAPITLGQSRFWFLKQYIEDQTTFNVTFSVRLRGPLQAARLVAAIQALGHRHQALRTAFVVQDGEQVPVQGVLKTPLLRIESKEIRDVHEVSQSIQELKDHVYAIERGETMRIILLTLSPLDHFLIFGYHHINMDGASIEVFLADMGKLYTGTPLYSEPYQYPTYAVQQQLDVQRGKMESDIAYWKRELADIPPTLPLLPYASVKTRTPMHAYNHNRVDREIDAKLSRRIRDVCRQDKVSQFHFYLAVFQVMLFRFLSVNDLCIGTADANRFEGNLATSIGMYLNILPLRFRFSQDQKFQETLKNTRRTAYAAMAHSRVPFDLVLDSLKVPRSTLHNPLFQVFMNYRAGVAVKRTMGDVEGQGGEYSTGRTPYDITLDVLDDPSSGPHITILVQSSLYSAQDASVLVDTYVHLLDYFSLEPASRLGATPVFTPESVEKAIILGRGNLVSPRWPETIVHRVDDVIRQHPDTIAVREPLTGRVWNFQQFGVRTIGIARSLLACNVTKGVRVAVFLEPGLDWMCSAMAIMRIGGTFVPLDVALPPERLAAMVKATRPGVVLFHDATLPQEAGLAVVQEGSCQAINVSRTITPLAFDHTQQGVPIMVRATDPAIIYFTSGSTGLPKGVLLSHEGFPNLIEHTCDIRGPEVVLHQSALGFDFATWQCFVALAYGGTLVVVPQALRGDPVAITSLMAEEGITCTGATPSEYLSWIQYGFSKLTQCKSWRLAATGGEHCPSKLVEDFTKLQLPGLHLWNMYGPSEITVASNQVEIDLSRPRVEGVTVGQTMPNRSVYILDDNFKPAGPGMPGEVVVGGCGIALGYLNNESLTTEKFFLDDILLEGSKQKQQARMYRTGDRGRITANGELEILGRIDGDSQIKLRGIRVEMQDIEELILLNADGKLTSVCVTARGEPSTLVAHAVFPEDCSVPKQDRKVFLHRLATSLPLPQYMHPAAIISIPSMPLTPHGKLDRQAVQGMPIQRESINTGRLSNAGFQLGDREIQLRGVWEKVIPSDVLSLYTVGRDTDFFHVGGNSMLLVKLQHLIQLEFGAKLPIMRLFETSTLGAMAAAVHDASVASADAPIDWEEEIALTKDLIDAVPTQEITARPVGIGLVVVLTGATGFIGREILVQLISSPDISRVHCIAVREPAKLAEFATCPKVSIYKGDLCSLDDLDDCPFLSAHALIHCGADVSFLKTYATLRKANVTSTKALARLALKHALGFHYISTVGTGRLLFKEMADDSNKQGELPNTPRDTFGEESVAAHSPPANWRDHYVASKWVSEAFLERAAARLGLKVWVHRPSSVTGAGVGETDVMSSVVRFANKLRAVPVSAHWRGAVDFVRVETVANGVVDAVVDCGKGVAQGRDGVKFLHHSGEIVIPIEGLKGYLEAKEGVQYQTVPLGKWVAMAVSEGMNVLVAAYLAAVDETGSDIVFQAYVKDSKCV